MKRFSGALATALALLVTLAAPEAPRAQEANNQPDKKETGAPKNDGPGAKDEKAGSDETLKKAAKLVEMFENFKIFGLVRFRPELKYNYNFDKSDLSCNTLTGCAADDDNTEFTGQKLWLGFENKFGTSVTARILIQDARVWGGETGSDTGLNTANSATNQSTDIREGWIDIKDLLGPIGLRVGRQRLFYGDERLVGHLDWTNVGRSFDGILFKYDSDFISSHFWTTQLAEEDSDSVGNDTSVGLANGDIDDAYFLGWYNTFKFSDHFHLDAYYLGKLLKWKQRTTPVTNPTVSFQMGFVPIVNTKDRARDRDNLHTLGIRFTNRSQDGGKRAPGPLDWSFEYAYQTGQTGNHVAAGWDEAKVVAPLPKPLFDATYNPCRIYDSTRGGCRVYTEKQVYDAYAYAATAGYTIAKTFRIGAEYTLASGDPDRTDGSTATFNNLFHTNHLHYGQADQISWQNMRGKSVNFSVNLKSYGKLKIAYWEFDKHRVQDGWYKVTGGGAGGARVGTTESSSNARYGSAYNGNTLNSLGVGYLKKHLFKELDLTYVIEAAGLEFNFGYSLVQAGDAVRAVKDPGEVKRETYGPLIVADLADGKLDNPVNVLQYQSYDFRARAHFAYVMTTYKF